MKKEYKTIINPEYGPMSPKVSLDPDFFSGFHPEHRKEIVGREARFYKSITDYFSVDDKLICNGHCQGETWQNHIGFN